MPAHSVPAYPKPVKFIQPDGTVVTYRIIGDEHNHWLESTDGYVLKKVRQRLPVLCRQGQ